MRALIAVSVIALVLNASAQDTAFHPRPARIGDGVAKGTASLDPDTFEVATIGDYRLEFVVGEGGIAEGGGILVDFPKAWFSNPVPLIKPVQADDPDAPHYVSVETSRRGADLNFAIDHIALDGSIERYRHVMKVSVAKKAHRAGDTIALTFANTTCPQITGTDTVRVAVDAEGDGTYGLMALGAGYTVTVGDPAWSLLTAPSDTLVGATTAVHLTLFDTFNNAIELADLESTVTVSDGQTAETKLLLSDRPRRWFEWTPSSAGDHWITAAHSVPIEPIVVRVTNTAPKTHVYWGDIHSHTRVSKDGIGGNEFEYARDAAHLDFYASTEHGGDDNYVEGEKPGDSISKSEWGRIVNDVRRFNDPGTFVTLLAYECSLPSGHHNVYYRGLDGMPWPAYRVGTAQGLWELLDRDDVITIPHHLGIQWGRDATPIDGPGLQPVRTGQTFIGGPRVDWTLPHDRTMRPAIEMYSKHGQSEYFDRSDPLAYESVRYTAGRSADGQHYAQDAWAAGHKLGVVAASDDHMSHPGLNTYGLTAVYAPELTREAIFDAIAARRTYATTGQRILLDFEAAGVKMGQETSARGGVRGKVTVLSPSEIAFAEVLAHTAGDDAWRTIARWDTPGKSLEETFNATIDAATTLYLRTELVNAVRGRVARAWSSPIWITP